MTDEQMDARLRRAGESWRVAAGLSDAGDFDEPLITPGSSRPRRTAVLAAAAVVAAALVAGAGFLLSGGDTRQRSSDAAVTPLEGTVWRLVDDGHRHAGNSLATLYISPDGRLVADDECAVLDLQVDVRGASLVPTKSNVRQRDCTDTTGPVFVRSADRFIGKIGYRIDGPRLTLTFAGTDLYLVAAPELPRPSADVPTRVGATWRLVKVLDGNDTDRPVSGSPTFRIDNGQLVASDGCNIVSGPIGPDGRALDNGRFAITERACADPAATATAAVVDAVLNGSPPEFVTTGTTLTLKKEHVGQLSYEWVPEDGRTVDVRSFVGRTWHLVSVAGEPAAADVTLRVDASNNLTANDGCGGFGALAELAPGSLSVAGRQQQPPPGCPKAAADQATTFDSFLHQNPALWTIRNGRLHLYGGGAQAFSLVFTPDVPPPTASPLLGKKWNLTTIEHNNGNSADGTGSSSTDVTLALGEHTFTLDSNCQGTTGQADYADVTITFSGGHPLGGPRLACRNFAEAEAEAVFAGTVQWSITNHQLRLTKGGTTLTFER